MVIGLVGLLLLAALVITLVHAVNRAPLWPAVLCVILAFIVQLGSRFP